MAEVSAAYLSSLHQLINKHAADPSRLYIAGCSTGALAFELSKTFVSIIASDYCGQYVAACESLKKGMHCRIYVSTICCNGSNAPFVQATRSLFRARHQMHMLSFQLESMQRALFSSRSFSKYQSIRRIFLKRLFIKLTWVPQELQSFPVVVFHEYLERALNPSSLPSFVLIFHWLTSNAQAGPFGFARLSIQMVLLSSLQEVTGML